MPLLPHRFRRAAHAPAVRLAALARVFVPLADRANPTVPIGRGRSIMGSALVMMIVSEESIGVLGLKVPDEDDTDKTVEIDRHARTRFGESPRVLG